MPELPEVEALRRGLVKTVIGSKIKSVKVLYPKLVAGKGTTRQVDIEKTNSFILGLEGRQILQITRRAKNIIFHLDDESIMLVHLKMTGQLVFKSRDGENDLDQQPRIWGGHPIELSDVELPNKHTGIHFVLDDGDLYYNDTRKFGYVLHFADLDSLNPENHFKGLGIEPLEVDVIEAGFTGAKNSPSLKGWQPQVDGVVYGTSEVEKHPTSYRGTPLQEGNWEVEVLQHRRNSPSLKGWQPQVDGVVLVVRELKLSYNLKLKEKARKLRKNGALSEVLFWQKVKNKQFFRLDFDRQKIIGNYIVDFYCKNLGLVVEIDGESHDFKGEYDLEREKYLKGLGLEIVHFDDRDVKKSLDSVLESLKDFILLKFGVQNTPSTCGCHPSTRGELECRCKLKNTPSADPIPPYKSGISRVLPKVPKINPEFTLEEFSSRMKRFNGNLKKLFLDQKVVVGLGNIYADEACFAARVRPTRNVETLKKDEVKKLYESICRILPKAVELGGSSVSNYLLADGSRGNYAREHKVYKRGGLECLECGSKLEKIQLAGRTTVFCKKCQK